MAPRSSSRPNSSQALVSLGALTGGLLSSSCCVIQLVLNYTSIGCAGFSALTPYRHVFRLMTGGFWGYLLLSQGLNKRTVTTVVVSCLLMASQDILAARNTGSLTLAGIQRLLSDYKLRAGSPEQQHPQQAVAASRTTLEVQGMRCEACAARLRQNIEAIDGVHGCTVHFAAGKMEVWSNSSSPVHPDVLLDAVRATDGSYRARVLERECFTTDDRHVSCPAGDASSRVDEL